MCSGIRASYRVLRWDLQAEEPEDIREFQTSQELLYSVVLAESGHLPAPGKRLPSGFIDPRFDGSLLSHWGLVRSVLCAKRCKST